MRMMQVCQRCRHVSSSMAIEGGLPPFLDLTLGMHGSAICPRCGGRVVMVKEGEVLPPEYRATPRGVALAALASATCWALFWWIGTMVMAALDQRTMSPAEVQAMLPSVGRFMTRLVPAGAVTGALLTLVAAWLASRSDVNTVHRADLMPLGQAQATLQTVVVAVILGLVLALLVAPPCAGDVPLRAAGIRAAFGVIQGGVGGSCTAGLLFRVCGGRRLTPGPF